MEPEVAVQVDGSITFVWPRSMVQQYSEIDRYVHDLEM